MERVEEVDIVAQALAQGLWREKTDPKSGRKYYANSKTKKTTWNLRKDLLAEKREQEIKEQKINAEKVQSQEAEANEHAKLLTKVKTRAEIEADLQSSVQDLQRRKRELQTELRDIKEPLVLEHKLLREVQRKLEQERSLCAQLNADLLIVRSQHEREQEVMMDKISKFKTELETQKAAAELRALEHKRLTDEAERMKKETHDRRLGLEDLRLQIRQAQSGLESAKGELAAKRLEVQQREQLLEERRKTLHECEVQRNNLVAAIADTRRDIEIAEAAARRSADKLAREGGNSMLRADYDRKVEFWRMLEGPLREVEDVEFMSKENANLQRHLSRARADEEALCKAVDTLKGELIRSRQRMKTLRADSDRLEAECRGLMTEASRREEAAAAKSLKTTLL